MLLSIYTCIKNGFFYDFHAAEMLRHHLPLADEIVVNEGYSSDGTFEKISNIDPKIKVFRTDIGKPDRPNWAVDFKDGARKRCAGEWCLLLDIDEFIPEWDFQEIRNYLEHASESMIPGNLINFYGNYKVYHADPERVSWPAKKMICHRNLPEMEVWGDGSNVRSRQQPFDWNCSPKRLAVHHFGMVRHAARLRQKWRVGRGGLYMAKPSWLKLPSFLFDWRPHDWMDAEFLGGLAIYDGPYVQAVRENPGEFVRDDMALYKYLKGRTVPVGARGHD